MFVRDRGGSVNRRLSAPTLTLPRGVLFRPAQAPAGASRAAVDL